MDRKTLLSTAAGVAGVLAAPGLVAAATADPRSLAERFAATLSAHDMVGFAALFSDDYLNHQVSAAAPAPPAGVSPKQGSVNFFAARLAGMPDLMVTIEAMVASSDRVAASFVYTGTHGGPLYGVPATGRHLRFTSCDIFTVRNGQFAEHWGMGDIAGTLAQIKAP